MRLVENTKKSAKVLHRTRRIHEMSLRVMQSHPALTAVGSIIAITSIYVLRRYLSSKVGSNCAINVASDGRITLHSCLIVNFAEFNLNAAQVFSGIGRYCSSSISSSQYTIAPHQIAILVPYCFIHCPFHIRWRISAAVW